MRNIFISYYLKKIKTNIVLKSKFYFYLIFKKSKLREIFMENRYVGNYTVKDLLDDIAMRNISLDTPIAYQRIEDFYFTEHEGYQGDILKPWQTHKIKDIGYYDAIHYNQQIENGKLVKQGKLDKDEVGRYFYENDLEPIDMNNENNFEQYIDVSKCFYDSENDILCITAHM